LILNLFMIDKIIIILKPNNIHKIQFDMENIEIFFPNDLLLSWNKNTSEILNYLSNRNNYRLIYSNYSTKSDHYDYFEFGDIGDKLKDIISNWLHTIVSNSYHQHGHLYFHQPVQPILPLVVELPDVAVIVDNIPHHVVEQQPPPPLVIDTNNIVNSNNISSSAGIDVSVAINITLLQEYTILFKDLLLKNKGKLHLNEVSRDGNCVFNCLIKQVKTDHTTSMYRSAVNDKLITNFNNIIASSSDSNNLLLDGLSIIDGIKHLLSDWMKNLKLNKI